MLKHITDVHYHNIRIHLHLLLHVQLHTDISYRGLHHYITILIHSLLPLHITLIHTITILSLFLCNVQLRYTHH